MLYYVFGWNIVVLLFKILGPLDSNFPSVTYFFLQSTEYIYLLHIYKEYINIYIYLFI